MKKTFTKVFSIVVFCFWAALLGGHGIVRASDNSIPICDLRAAINNRGTNLDSLWLVYQNKGLKNKAGFQALGDFLMVKSLVGPFKNDTLSKVYLQEAIAQKNYPAEEQAYSLLTVIYKNKYEKDSLFKYFERILKVKGGPHSKFNLGRAYKMKGLSESELGNIYAAVKYINQAIELFQETSAYQQLASAYNSAGLAYGMTGKHHGTLAYYFKAVEAHKLCGYTRGLLTMYNNIADLYIRVNLYDSSEFFLKKIEELGKTMQLSPIDLFVPEFTYGELQIKQGKKKEGLARMQLALQNVLPVLGNRHQNVTYLEGMKVLGQAYIENERYKEAEEIIRQGIDLAKSNQMKMYLAQLYGRYAELHKRKRQYDSALYYLDASNQVRDQMRMEDAAKINEELSKKLELNEKVQRLKLADEQNKYLAQSLKESERTRLLGFSLMLVCLAVIVGGVFVLHNIRKKNRDLTQTQIALRKANQTKDKLFAVVAHDLRGPIGGLKSIPQLLRNIKDENGNLIVEPEELALAVEKSVNPVYNLMEDLLMWVQTNQQELTLEIYSQELNPVLENLKEVYQPLAEAKNVNLSFDFPETVYATFDSNSLFTILRNLLGNAIKFTPPFGEVSIQVKQEMGYVEIYVSDSGKGIPKHVIDSLYKDQQKNSSVGTAGEKGTGIGLTLVTELAKLNRINIFFDTKEGVGTTVKLILNG